MLSISIANPYEYPLDFPALKAAAKAVLEGEGVRAAKVTLAFVDDAHIHRLNKQFLDHDEPTDVLTFPYTDAGAKTLEGDIVIGYEVGEPSTPPTAATTSDLELLLYVIHGCLHLCGYDDTTAAGRGEMRAKERRVPDEAGPTGHRREGVRHPHVIRRFTPTDLEARS